MIACDIGDIVSVEFPFSDLLGRKRRPGLVLAVDTHDALLARLTTHPPRDLNDTALRLWAEAGLPQPSTVRLTKLATIDRRFSSSPHWPVKTGGCPIRGPSRGMLVEESARRTPQIIVDGRWLPILYILLILSQIPSTTNPRSQIQLWIRRVPPSAEFSGIVAHSTIKQWGKGMEAKEWRENPQGQDRTGTADVRP